MDTQKLDQTYIANTYARFPVTIVKGKGSLVWDDTGKEYIDLSTGIAVDIFVQVNANKPRAIEGRRRRQNRSRCQRWPAQWRRRRQETQHQFLPNLQVSAFRIDVVQRSQLLQRDIVEQRDAQTGIIGLDDVNNAPICARRWCQVINLRRRPSLHRHRAQKHNPHRQQDKNQFP